MRLGYFLLVLHTLVLLLGYGYRVEIALFILLFPLFEKQTLALVIHVIVVRTGVKVWIVETVFCLVQSVALYFKLF